MSTAEAPGKATEALVERLFAAMVDTLEVASVHVGGRLGLYRALADGGDATPGELAARASTDERYVREWLEQQAVAGFLTVHDPRADPAARRYTLPEAHRPVLVDEEDLSYLTGFAQFTMGVLRPLDALIAAYRTGEGVPYEAFGPDAVDGIAAANRPQFHHLLAGWFAAIPEVDARLRADPPARAADVGCGSAGRASRSRARTRRRASTRWTSTPTRSRRLARMSPRPAWPAACGRSSTTRAIPISADASTS
jgi:hypothetical protein